MRKTSLDLVYQLAKTDERIVFIGSDFETKVWQTLLRIPMGQATTYSKIASHIGNPKASRAVGAAVGKNLAATDSRLAGAETVATGAHEVARLKGTLHRGCP